MASGYEVDYSTTSGELSALRATLKSTRAYEEAEKDEASRRQTQRDNSSRAAYAEMTYIVQGTGQRRITKPLEFPVVFRSEPHVTMGFSVIRNPDSDGWHDPIASIGIYAWKRNKRGLYLGAFIYVRVDADPVSSVIEGPPPNDFRTQIYLTFSGKAVKNVASSSTTIAKNRTTLFSTST